MRRTSSGVFGGIAVALVSACTPMQVRPLPSVSDADRSPVLIYRTTSGMNAAALGVIVGQNGSDYFTLGTNSYAEFDSPSGEQLFFARTRAADRPYELEVELEPGVKKCILVAANRNNWVKSAVLPVVPLLSFIGYVADSTFTLSEQPCPSNEDLKKLTKEAD